MHVNTRYINSTRGTSSTITIVINYKSSSLCLTCSHLSQKALVASPHSCSDPSIPAPFSSSPPSPATGVPSGWPPLCLLQTMGQLIALVRQAIPQVTATEHAFKTYRKASFFLYKNVLKLCFISVFTYEWYIIYKSENLKGTLEVQEEKWAQNSMTWLSFFCNSTHNCEVKIPVAVKTLVQWLH